MTEASAILRDGGARPGPAAGRAQTVRAPSLSAAGVSARIGAIAFISLPRTVGQVHMEFGLLLMLGFLFAALMCW